MNNRLLQAFICFLILMTLFNTQVFADIGPKPSLNIHVQNMDTQDYYLDVLVPGNEEFYEEFNRNYSDRESMYKAMPLYQYKTENWMAKHIRSFLLFGQLQGTYNERTKMIDHRFSYHGVPQTFKIIIQYPDKRLWVSEVIDTNQFNATVLLDMESGKLQTIKGSYIGFIENAGTLSMTLLICLLLTLLIELLIAIPMKIRPLKVVAIANICSQIFLHVMLLTFFFAKQYQYMNTVFLLSELVVLMIEYFILQRFTSGITKRKLIQYVLIANLSTFLIGLFIKI